MRIAIQRLSLGFVLIALSSAVLLISDWGQRKEALPGSPGWRLCSTPRNLFWTTASAACSTRSRPKVSSTAATSRFNASMRKTTSPPRTLSPSQVTTGEYDMVITASTLSMQTVANANKAGRTIACFRRSSRPIQRRNRDQPRESRSDHPKHLVGLGSMIPVDKAFQMARAMFPGLKSVGLAWNSAESNSEAFTRVGRQVCKEMGIELMEANVDSSSAVLEAASSLVARGAQALWVSGDVTVLVALESAVAAARKGRIPVFTITPPGVQRGSLFDSGVNFYEVGEQTGAVGCKHSQGRRSRQDTCSKSDSGKSGR